MERIKHWRAKPTRSIRVHRTKRRRSLGAAVAAGAMVAVAMPVLSTVSSDAAVGGRRSIEVTTMSDMVILEGYPRRAQVRITAIRGGVIVGSAVKRVQPGGTIEMNHGGGPAGDCWESARTPNLRPGDRIRTRIIGTRIIDSMVVRGLFIDTVERGDTSVSVSGHVRLAGRTGVPSGALELRVRTDTDQRQNIRAEVSDVDGSWGPIDVPVAAGQAAGAEVVLEWIGGGAGELTVAEPGDPALRASAQRLPGCPPIEAN